MRIGHFQLGLFRDGDWVGYCLVRLIAPRSCFTGVWSFPLPENAAVDRMRIQVADRVIEGEIQERAQAQATYEKAKAEGKAIDRDAFRDLYVEAHVDAAEFYDQLARQVIGRSPAHVMLLHETDIAALWIGDLVAALRAKGWTIVSADEAFADPIAADAATYDTPFAQGTLTEQVAWQEGVPAPRWYRGNNTDLAQEWFDARVLARSADDED